MSTDETYEEAQGSPSWEDQKKIVADMMTTPEQEMEDRNNQSLLGFIKGNAELHSKFKKLEEKFGQWKAIRLVEEMIENRRKAQEEAEDRRMIRERLKDIVPGERLVLRGVCFEVTAKKRARITMKAIGTMIESGSVAKPKQNE